MKQLLLILFSGVLASFAPLPEFLCPSNCLCLAAIEIQGAPVGGGVTGAQPLTAQNGSLLSATVTWDTNPTGWGPKAGQCKKQDTDCAECDEKKCGFLIKLNVNLTGNIDPDDTYKWFVDLPGASDPGGSIDPSSGAGNSDDVDKDLDCNIPTTGWISYDIKVRQYHSGGGSTLIALGTVKVKCPDCLANEVE